MKNCPHTVIVLVLTLVAFWTLGCEPKGQVTQEEGLVEGNALVETQMETVEVTAAAETAKKCPVKDNPENCPVKGDVAECPVKASEESCPAKAEVAEAVATVRDVKKDVAAEVVKEEPAEEAPAETPKADAVAVATDDVAVTVDGVVITGSALAERISMRIEQMKRQGMPPEAEEQQRKGMRDQLLQGMILEALLNAEVKKENIEQSTADEVDKEIEKIAKMQNMSMDDLVKMLESRGQSLDDMKQYFSRSLTYRNLLVSKYGEQLKVSDEEAKQDYDTNGQRYNTPERVRASHILISPESDANTDPNDAKAAAKAKAEELLKQIKEEADFAELAKANSSCSSASRGGDLNFFGRGQMAPPFEEAAFSLAVGQISDVVETQFGFHIIKVTGKQETKVTPFEEAKEEIAERLKMQKENQVGGKYVEELKAAAKIVYPEGKEPKPQGMEIQATPIK